MIVEVNDAGEIVIPAVLVQAPPRTRLEADRDGDALVVKPAAEQAEPRKRLSVTSLPVIKARLMNPTMTFRREDIYGDDGR